MPFLALVQTPPLEPEHWAEIRRVQGLLAAGKLADVTPLEALRALAWLQDRIDRIDGLLAAPELKAHRVAASEAATSRQLIRDLHAARKDNAIRKPAGELAARIAWGIAELERLLPIEQEHVTPAYEILDVAHHAPTGFVYVLANFWRNKAAKAAGEPPGVTNDFILDLRPRATAHQELRDNLTAFGERFRDRGYRGNHCTIQPTALSDADDPHGILKDPAIAQLRGSLKPGRRAGKP